MRTKILVGLLVAVVVLVVAGVSVFLATANGAPGQVGATGDEEPDNGGADAEAEPEPVSEAVAEGFDQAWGMAFLPGQEHRGQLVVAEKPGTLSIVDTETGDVSEVDGAPEVDAEGQGGLLDVEVDPEFPESAWLYLTYSAPDGDGGTSTTLARGQLDADQASLTGLEELFTAPSEQTSDHYGSKVTFGPDGNLYMTVGDRGDKDFDDHVSRDTSNTLGTTLRLEPDGSVPDDNPFVDDDGFADEIYSYGHRNVQAMTVHPETEEIWQGEHGEQDGDAINIIEAGGDYGWPETHTGCTYGTGEPLGEHPSERDDVVDPVYYWECNSGGFPPSGMVFYQGEEFPAWDGDLLIGGLYHEYLARFTVDGEEVEETEGLLEDEGWRIRNVAVGPHDGAVYAAVDDEDAPLVRIVDGADE